MKPITEYIIEASPIEILQSQGWEYANGRKLSTEGLRCERENYQHIIHTHRILKAIAAINPHIPSVNNNYLKNRKFALINLTYQLLPFPKINYTKPSNKVFSPQYTG